MRVTLLLVVIVLLARCGRGQYISYVIQSTDPVDIANEIEQQTQHTVFDFRSPVRAWSEQLIVTRDDVTLMNLAVKLDAEVNEAVTLLQIAGAGVTMRNFSFVGTADLFTPQAKDGIPMVVVRGDAVDLEDGYFEKVKGNALMIGGAATFNFPGILPRTDISSCKVYNIRGRDIERDLVSIAGDKDFITSGCNVQMVWLKQSRGWDSKRGALELSDNTINSFAKDIYARRAQYVLDIQDHGPAIRTSSIKASKIVANECNVVVSVSGRRGDTRNEDIVVRNMKAFNMQLPDVITVEYCRRCSFIRLRVHKSNPTNVSMVNVLGSEDVTIRNALVDGETFDESVHMTSTGSSGVALI